MRDLNELDPLPKLGNKVPEWTPPSKEEDKRIDDLLFEKCDWSQMTWRTALFGR